VDRVADREGAGLDHAHEPPAPADERLLEPGPDLVHALARMAGRGQLEDRIAHAEARAEGQRLERQPLHRDLFADRAGLEPELVQHLLLGEQHLAPAPESRVTVAVQPGLAHGAHARRGNERRAAPRREMDRDHGRGHDKPPGGREGSAPM
jgi:hypothetical protein